MKYSSEQIDGAVARSRHDGDGDRVLRLHPAVGVVCPGCGARIGKVCVSTVPTLGVGAVGVAIEGVHSERIAAAREQGVA